MTSQPTQPLTDAELMEINYNLNEALNRCGELYLVTDAPKDMRRLLVEVDRLRSALTALARNEQAAANRSLELQEENERLRLEAAQMESGAQIVMNAVVTALQEVKRLEIVRDDLKLINDRMAEDRLRLVDERDELTTKLEERTTQWRALLNLRERDAVDYRELKSRMNKLRAENDSIFADLLQYSQLHWEACPLDAEDCYLCEGYERIRANAAERRHGKAPNQ